MRCIVSKFAWLSSWMALSLAAQTQIDLRTQTKSVDFSTAPYTRPLQSGASLPSTCTQSSLFFLSSAPAGSNMYGCVATNTWAVQGGGGGSGSSGGGSGSLTIQNNGTTVGSQGTVNFIPGAGIVDLITNTGSAISVQQNVDTAVVLSKVTNQAGTPLLCASASGSGTTYTCAMMPTLTTYTTGMVLHWKIDTTSTTASPTLNVDSLGTKTVVDYQGNALSAGGLVAGTEIPIWYDGSNMRCMTCGLAASGGTGGGSTLTSLSLPIGGIYDPAGANTVSLWIPGAANPGFSSVAGVGTVMVMPGGYCTSPNSCAAYTRFWWPQNFNNSAPVNIVLRTMPATSGGIGTIIYSAQFACPADGTSLVSPTYNAVSSTNLTVLGTADAGQTVTISNVAVTGCSAGSEAYLNVYRDGSGTPGSGAADYVTSVRVDYATH
jgi:hypothetical protein